MPQLPECNLFWSLTAIQTCGLLSAWLTRGSGGSRLKSCWECLFLALLVLVGISTMAAIVQSRGSHWIFGGATLGLMVLMAVWDCRPDHAARQPHLHS